MSSSYSCPNCCPDSGPFGDIIPLDPLAVNGSEQVNTIGTYYDCNGYPINIGGLPIEQWFMDDLSIAAPIPPWGSGTQLYGISGGETSINGIYSWDQWDLVDGYSQCDESRGQTYVTAGVDVLDVRILRDGTEITQAADVIVGQRIELALQAVPSGSISEIQWSVPGIKIGGYVANNSTGTVTPLGSLQNDTLIFYWVDGGDGRQVTVSCKINGMPVSKTATFNVKRPTAQVSITTSSTNIGTDSQSGITELRLGNPATTPGLTFTRTVSIPSGFNGSTQWVQVFTKKSASLLDFNAQVTTLNKAGLDDVYPYPLDAGATSANLKTSDTPALFLDGFVSGSVDFEATMWLLFRPTAGTNPIWVPLRKVSWVWTANATYDGTTWTINSPSDPTNLSDSDSTSHPQWTTNAN